jgi:hypothetical protein
MALDFQVRDVIHNIVARFVRAYLPDAKKPYYLRAQFQPELDVHGIASKAEVYNIETDPKVIEEGMNAGMELMHYLVADGYKVKTPIFNLSMRLPGEYSGDETHLNEGGYPVARLNTTAGFRKYLRNTVQVSFAGIADDIGHIGEVIDEATGSIDETATIGDVITIRGHGLKIEGEGAYIDEAGVYFTISAATRIKCKRIVVNEPTTLKVIVPALTEGMSYNLELVTQSAVKGGGTMLKAARVVLADFLLKAAAPAV